MDRVQNLLKELGLDHVAGARIGSESSRGISGGEKRRVSIGVDLVHDPAVLLIDEPTLGLDSASALHLMKLLNSITKRRGKSILLTIHQPGFRILELIDNIVLLSNGSVFHNGPLCLLEERLRCAGDIIPQHVNLLEFAIECAESFHVEDSDIELCKTEKQNDDKSSSTHVKDAHISHANSWFKEVTILCQRTSSNIFRTKQLFAARIVQVLLAGILLGTVFMNANNNSKLDLETRLAFFAACLGFLFLSSTEILPIILQERKILKRETTRGAYRISSYVVANAIVFIPFLFVITILFSTPIYFIVGLRRNVDGYIYFSLVVWMVFLMANSFVACFGALVPNFTVGTPLIAGVQRSFFLFSGYFIAKDDIPKYWIFMHYLSLFKYPFECFLVNEYGGEEGKRRCLVTASGRCITRCEGISEMEQLSSDGGLYFWVQVSVLPGPVKQN